MGKESAEKPRREKKNKKTLDTSNDEPSVVEDVPMEDAEPVAEPSATEAATPDKKKAKKSKKAAKEANGSDNEDEGGAALFTIDTAPAPVNIRDQSALGDDADLTEEQRQEKKKALRARGFNAPPSGLNRQARRRIRLIEERREKIQKKLGVPVGSTERADEVQTQLDEWIAEWDEKNKARDDKKRARKQKEAARLKSKRGKVLTGRRLKDRTKELKKMGKLDTQKPAGISAPKE
ncbi:hypothetical protein M426DRAFT_317656 [Hypoxylon sp. CI-4A]|nr:hypothetical protein M426DRAFT_317656 [Hypoxylon sp. CI-4A]